MNTNPNPNATADSPLAPARCSGARYLDVQCSVCGWKDEIRADYWSTVREYWCDECNGQRQFRLVAQPNAGTEPLPPKAGVADKTTL